MKKTIGLLALVVLLGGNAAFAQSGTGTGTGSSAGSTDVGGMTQAPIGHRQPRAGQVPNEQDLRGATTKEDKLLDKKLRSICRGC